MVLEDNLDVGEGWLAGCGFYASAPECSCLQPTAHSETVILGDDFPYL